MDPYIGEIRLFAGSYAPDGWLLCNGQALQINGNQALYSLIGTTYGGDGKTTFNIPDLRGLLACGTGQGTGLTNNYTLGQTFGQATVTLTQAQTPHTHTVLASTSPASSSTPINNVFAATASPAVLYAQNSLGGVTQRAMDSAMLSVLGGNQAHSNLMASIAVSYIICVQGLFPEFN